MDIIKSTIKLAAKTFLAVEKLNDPIKEKFRMDTCKACPNYYAEDMQCTICTCFMDVKTTLKTNKNPLKMGRIEETHCPNGYWNDKETANYYRAIDGKILFE